MLSNIYLRWLFSTRSLPTCQRGSHTALPNIVSSLPIEVNGNCAKLISCEIATEYSILLSIHERILTRTRICVLMYLNRQAKATGSNGEGRRAWIVGDWGALTLDCISQSTLCKNTYKLTTPLLFLLPSAYSYNNNSNAAANSITGNIVPKNDKNAIMQNIANSYQRTEASNNTSATAANWLGPLTKRRRTKSRTKSRDCRVSHWSEWSACSKTCGIGEMHRYRKVIRHGKRGGRPCPALQQSKWCGTEKGCHSPATYFNW